MELRPFDLVKVRAEVAYYYKGILSTDDQFIFLGEINQMPGHGVFVVLGTGKTYAGYHIDSFELVSKKV